jgi:pyridoxamine 5'-phosphate oxidase
MNEFSINYFEGMRRTYEGPTLEEGSMASDPIIEFRSWISEVEKMGLPEANAMVLATVGLDGSPNARIVLLKECDLQGFSFFTNMTSVKGRELERMPAASLVFPWHSVSRQVRVRGKVEPVAATEATEYFATRPRASQLAAWASRQSESLESREALQREYEISDHHFRNDQVPRPRQWGGYRVVPQEIEFWSGRSARLHERIRYTRQLESDWEMTRLNP